MKHQLNLQEVIEESNNIVFFGGAGVSTESGIPDFRSNNGVYNTKYKYPAEEILSHSFYINHTAEFFDFYKTNMVYPDAVPNKAHIKLACLERKGKLKAIVTQNIDGLHQKAGSMNVLELHGSVYRNYCTKCGKYYPLEYILESSKVPLCSCGGKIKPDVVLYEEELNRETIEKSVEAIISSDVLIVAGTSLSVYPAASLIDYYRGNKLILINKTPTPKDSNSDLVLHGSIGEILEKII